MYFFLVMLTEGAASNVVRSVRDQNGPEAFRRLANRYSPKTKGKALAKLGKIINPDFGDDIKTMMDKVIQWERDVDEYETTAKDKISDQVKCAALCEHSPKEVKLHLTLNAANLKYPEMRALLESLLNASTGWDPDKMQVDAVKGKGKDGKGGNGKQDAYKGKSKGDKDGKGKSKGKNNQEANKNNEGKQKFTGACHNCGRVGHRAVDCWRPKVVGTVEGQETAAAESVTAIVQGDPVGDESDGWLMTISPVSLSNLATARSVSAISGGMNVSILVDSGSSVNCCGPGHFPQSPIEPSTRRRLFTAKGDPLRFYGTKRVHLTAAGEHIHVTFLVLDVIHPILSVSACQAKGIDTHFSAKGRSVCKSMPISRKTCITVAPVNFSPPKVSSDRTCFMRLPQGRSTYFWRRSSRL